jgi:hypothetical protein
MFAVTTISPSNNPLATMIDTHETTLPSHDTVPPRAMDIMCDPHRRFCVLCGFAIDHVEHTVFTQSSGKSVPYTTTSMDCTATQCKTCRGWQHGPVGGRWHVKTGEIASLKFPPSKLRECAGGSNSVRSNTGNCPCCVHEAKRRSRAHR